MTGKPLCASKAAESASPVFTRFETSSSCAGKVGVLLDLGQHLQRAQNGQSGPDQGQKLLVEDEKRLQLDLAPPESAKAAPGADAENVVAGMGKAGAQLLGGRRRLHLLLHAPTLIGQLDDELCHALLAGPEVPAFPRFFISIQGTSFGCLSL